MGTLFSAAAACVGTANQQADIAGRTHASKQSSSAIGVSEILIPGSESAPALPLKLWYPTAPGPEKTYGDSRIRPGYNAIAGGQPLLNEETPLIILIHGSGGDPDGMAWLAQDLALRGALVVGAAHPDSSGGNPERLSILHVWSQPDDVSRLIDFLSESEWSARFDSQRIAAVGFSAGGASAMLLAGARLDFAKFPEFCERHNDGACEAFRHHFSSIDKNFLSQANADHSDASIAAAVAIAPGFTEAMTPDSIKHLQAPTLIIAGALDQQLPPKTHLLGVPQQLPKGSEYTEISDAQHFSFLPVCRENAATVLAETNETFVCEEFGAKSRMAIHKETFNLISDFFADKGLF